jgi:hypothetical protein
MRGLHLLGLMALALTAVLLAACGDDSSNAPEGSAEKPLQAEEQSSSVEGRVNEASTPGNGGGDDSGASAGSEPQAPGYEALVEGQSKDPRDEFSPCNLVTKAQASEIVGGPVKDPLEAAQGPTCIYESESGESFITVAVQSVDFGEIERRLNQLVKMAVSDRTAYCGQYGQRMLYVPLSQGRVLSIAGPCPVAKQFALEAVERLEG